jgi:hypothetical protein
MTGPGHRDVAVALGATLATFRGERDVVGCAGRAVSVWGGCGPVHRGAAVGVRDVRRAEDDRPDSYLCSGSRCSCPTTRSRPTQPDANALARGYLTGGQETSHRCRSGVICAAT